MSNPPVSRFPIPDLADLPEDIREQIEAVQEKTGFIPNVFLALAHRLNDAAESQVGRNTNQRTNCKHVTEALHNTGTAREVEYPDEEAVPEPTRARGSPPPPAGRGGDGESYAAWP